ncbi:MAG: hypothetical protein HUU04_10755, partial [Verrucomicrobiae bacterium]|nr:hypothetical protein [Verrucomicrobiae bacterium]
LAARLLRDAGALPAVERMAQDAREDRNLRNAARVVARDLARETPPAR